ncbi:MAG: hypothetical protein ACOCWA_03045 [Bacteroidota bacterium]
MKKIHKKSLLILTVPGILFCLSQKLFAQNELDDEFLDHSGELFIETENRELAAEVFEELSEIIQRKENINAVKAETLRKLPFITDFQIHSFLEYRRKYGQIYSQNELWLITGFHENLIKKFALLFDFGAYAFPKKNDTPLRSPLRHSILVRSKIEHPIKEGFKKEKQGSDSFTGCQLYRLLKYELKKKEKIRLGVTMENDAGESFTFDSVSRGFDFNSAFLECTFKRFPVRMILGDYRISSAEGLIYSYGRGGKSSMNAFKRSLPAIKKYASTTEYGFYRGLTVQFSKEKIRILSYYSRKAEDARTYVTPDSGNYFLSENTSGFHRNEKENKRKNTLLVESAGLISAFTNDNFQAGYNLKYMKYSPAMGYTRFGDPHSEFLVREKFLWQSFFYNLQWKSYFLSGEIAFLRTGGSAIHHKASLNIHPLWTININYRNYSPEYFCPGAASFSEGSEPHNEKGLFTEIMAYPFNFLKLQIYLDNYYFPWINTRSSAPLSGTDFLLATEWYLLKKLDLKLYVKNERRETSYLPFGQNMKKTSSGTSSRFYTQLSYHLNENFSCRNRVEIKWEKVPGKPLFSGNLMYMEMNRYLFDRQLKINVRYTVFDIPDWDVRIYSWEHDLLYAFSSPSYYKSGYNAFANLRWKMTNDFSLGLKISSTFYTTKRQSGTGADSRNSDNYHYMKGQMIIKL